MPSEHCALVQVKPVILTGPQLTISKVNPSSVKISCGTARKVKSNAVLTDAVVSARSPEAPPTIIAEATSKAVKLLTSDVATPRAVLVFWKKPALEAEPLMKPAWATGVARSAAEASAMDTN
jgi:hypothetical protein